jgi:hypothetical protein
MGLLFPIYGKMKNVPNHQPASNHAIMHSNFEKMEEPEIND